MNLLKQSTAATIKLGPFVDDTDGKTAETALTIGQADIRLSKNGGDIAQTNNATGATHDELGYYDIPLDTTDTGTLGRLRVLVSKAGALPVWQDFLIVTANVYDTLCSTDTFDVNVTALANDVITSNAFDESSAYPLKSADTGATQVARVGADSDTLETLSDEIAAVKAETALILADTGTDGVVVASGQTVATVTNLTNLPTMPADWVTASGLKADAVTKIQSGLATAAALDAVDNFVDTEVAAILAAVDTEVAAIKAKTDNLPASPAAVGSAMTLTAAYDKAKDDVLTPLAVVDGIVDAIKAQTDKIPATPASAGEYTANIGAIKAKTDNLPLSPASSGEYTSALTAIQNDLDNPNQYKADVSNLALQATSLAIKGQTDKIPAAPAQTGEYNAALTAIQADLDNPAQYRADVSGLATQESVNAIPTTPLLAANYTAPDNAGIGAIKTKTDQLTFTTLNKVDASATIDPTGLATSADLAVVDENVDAIKEKTDQMAFTVANKIDASATVDPTGIATSEELEIIGEKVDGVLDKLNVSTVQFVTSVVGSTITILRGDTLTASLLNLGSMESYVSLDFTVKASMHQSDDDAVIRIRKNASGLTDGLLRLNGAAHTTGTDGSITINDAPTGNITIMLKAGVTDDLVPGTYVYDIQLIEAAEVTTLTTGSLIVTADVTRLVA